MQRFWNETSERHRFLARDSTRPILPPGALFLDAEAFFSLAQRHGRIVLGERAAALDAVPPLPRSRSSGAPKTRSRACDRFAEDYDGRILIVAEAGRRETLVEMFAEFGIPFGDSANFDRRISPRVRRGSHSASRRCMKASRCAAAQFAILTETELYAATRGGCAASSASGPRTSRP